MFILSYTTETDPKGRGVAAKHVEEGKWETWSRRWRPNAPNVPKGFGEWHTAMFWSNLH
jgi:hypothetical protein